MFKECTNLRYFTIILQLIEILLQLFYNYSKT